MVSQFSEKTIDAFITPVVGRTAKFRKSMAEIINAILAARVLRISSIAHAMQANYETAYRRVTRFLNDFDDHDMVLRRMLCENVPFLIGDPSIIERPEAEKTDYVGFVRPEQRGFYLLTIAAPFKGRALPVMIHDYSPATIGNEGSSRNIEHGAALEKIKEITGETPIIFDREFSYAKLLEDFQAEGLNYVIRLNTKNHVKLTDKDGNVVELSIGHGRRKSWTGLYYKGKIKVNVAAIWEKGFKSPLFVVTSLENAEEAIDLYLQRMKIELMFRDLKSEMGIDKNMSIKRENMQKLIVLAMLAYTMAVLVGEQIREKHYDQKKEPAIAASLSFSYFVTSGASWLN
jgi:hypothetical protein